jgi:hypothetical protein
MHLDKFVNSTTGRIIMSILLGIGLATLFRAVCKGKRCRIVAAPPMEELEDQTYKFDGKCYKMEKNPVKCDAKKQVVKIQS